VTGGGPEQLVHIGVKLFWRDSKDRDTCPYRVVQVSRWRVCI
jgi:hypothetical protein